MADLEEPGIYNHSCPKGHRTAFCLQNFKFEMRSEACETNRRRND